MVALAQGFGRLKGARASDGMPDMHIDKVEMIVVYSHLPEANCRLCPIFPQSVQYTVGTYAIKERTLTLGRTGSGPPSCPGCLFLPHGRE